MFHMHVFRLMFHNYARYFTRHFTEIYSLAAVYIYEHVIIQKYMHGHLIVYLNNNLVVRPNYITGHGIT